MELKTDTQTGLSIAVVGIFYVAALQVPLSLGITPDVSWLLTVAERMLSGETLYRDILEYNPPFSVWIYTGPAALSFFTGLSSETLLLLQFSALFFLSFAACLVIGSRAGLLAKGTAAPQLAVGIAVFVLLPNYTFLQREHFAIVAFTPWLVLQAARWHAGPAFRPSVWMVVLGGLSCAIMVMTKPYYLPTVLLPVAGLMLKTRSLRPPFHPENLLGAAVAAAYGLAVLTLYPDYLEFLYPILDVVYLPVRTPDATLFFLTCGGVLLLAVALAAHPRDWSPLAITAALAASGHLAGIVAMGKAFTYHALPALCLLVLAFAAQLAARRFPEPRPSATGTLALTRISISIVLVGTVIWLVSDVYRRGEFVDPVLANHLKANHAGQTFVSVSPSFADSHPLVRIAGGRYVGPHGAMLATDYGMQVLRQNPDMDTRAVRCEIERERAIYAAAILSRQPGIILVSDRADSPGDSAWETIAKAQSGGQTIRQLYVFDARFDGMTVLRRR